MMFIQDNFLINFTKKGLSILFVSLLTFCFSEVKSQSILMDSVSNTCLNTIVNIPFRVKNFKRILGIQGSISWDTTFVKYYNISYNTTTIPLSSTNFNLNSAVLGTVTYVWTDQNAVAETVLDSTILFTLQLKVAKSIVGSTNVSFTNTPTPLAIVAIDSTGSYSISKNTSYQKGNVGFISQPTISKNRDTLIAIANGIPSYYQWNINTLPISGANSKAYTNASVMGGSYSVTIKYANGCVATSATILPLAQLTISGYLKSNCHNNPIIHLDWNKINNTNQSKIVLEKSKNGIDFFALKVFNTDGVSINNNLNFEDTLINKEEKCFYRLIMLFRNGSNSYSNTVNISLIENNLFQLYPNPTKNALTVRILNNIKEPAILDIKDIFGNIIFNQNTMLNSGINTIPVYIATLKSGNYTLFVRTNRNVYSKQFIKL